MNVARPSPAQIAAAPVTFYLFDVLYCDGYDLRAAPLIERKRLLKKILDPKPPLRYSDHVLAQGEDLFELAREHGAEGIIGKQMHSSYAKGRIHQLGEAQDQPRGRCGDRRLYGAARRPVASRSNPGGAL